MINTPLNVINDITILGLSMEIEIRKDLCKRERYLKKIRGFYNECEIIKVLTGVRRCGKSSLMNLVIQELMESGVRPENILYFNLDNRLWNIS